MTISQEAIDEIRAISDADQPHWRLMYRKDTREVFVACLQQLDYNDYGDCGFVNETKYETEEAANKDWIVSHFYTQALASGL